MVKPHKIFEAVEALTGCGSKAREIAREALAALKHPDILDAIYKVAERVGEQEVAATQDAEAKAEVATWE